MSEIQKPSIGRIVHYVVARQHDGLPVIQPAIVVAFWPQYGDRLGVNLQVFLDGSNVSADRYPACQSAPSAEECAKGLAWRTSAMHSATQEPGTWHWPTRDA